MKSFAIQKIIPHSEYEDIVRTFYIFIDNGNKNIPILESGHENYKKYKQRIGIVPKKIVINGLTYPDFDILNQKIVGGYNRKVEPIFFQSEILKKSKGIFYMSHILSNLEIERIELVNLNFENFELGKKYDFELHNTTFSIKQILF